MAVPTRHIRRVVPAEGPAFDDDVLENVIERIADVDVAVGKGRPVVQDELLRAGARGLDAVIQPDLLPFFESQRFARDQVGPHGEVRPRQVQCIFVIHRHSKGTRTVSAVLKSVNGGRKNDEARITNDGRQAGSLLYVAVQGEPPFALAHALAPGTFKSAGQPGALQTLREVPGARPTARQRLECVELAPAFARGSGKASIRFGACTGTMNRDEAAAGALASWTAAVLCRFCARGPDPKAPEDWRTPKPRGVPAGSWKVRNVAFGGPTATLARMEKRDK